MNIETKRLEDLNPAKYNPRKELKPGDPTFEKLKRSIETFGYVEPIIWNERTGNVVGGHQRLSVLKSIGETQAECVVVNMPEDKEKELNVALNKITGEWEPSKLEQLLGELDEAGAMELTGFDFSELEEMRVDYGHIQNLLEEDFFNTPGKDKAEKNSFTMTFVIKGEDAKAVEAFVTGCETAKSQIKNRIMVIAEGIE